MRLSLPPSINATYKTNRFGSFYKSKEAKDWEIEAGYQIIAQKPLQNLTGDVKVTICMMFARDRDVDSSLKVILDLLQKQNIYLNDSQVMDLHVLKIKVPKGQECCEVLVQEL